MDPNPIPDGSSSLGPADDLGARPAAHRVGGAGEGRRCAAGAVVGLPNAAAVGRPHAGHARRDRPPRPRDPAGAGGAATPPPPPASGWRRTRPTPSRRRPSSSNRRGPIARASAAARWRSPSAAGRSHPRRGEASDARRPRRPRVVPAGQTRRYRSRLHRPDGVEVELDGGSYNRVGGPDAELPHDLAHLVVEDELALREGVWGVLVAGGMFGHATVVAGRRKPQATKHGKAVIARAGDRIMQAEVLTRAICDLCAADAPVDPAAVRRAVGERWWTDSVTPAALAQALVTRLREAAAQLGAPGAAARRTTRTEPRAPDRRRSGPPASSPTTRRPAGLGVGPCHAADATRSADR